jgi:peptidyl-prolyl cis-trans isomerase SurA
MKKTIYAILVGLFIFSNVTFSQHAQARELLDKVAVIVDQGVILESEISVLVEGVKANALTSGQTLPSDAALRRQAIERLILESLQSQMAERMGIQVSDPQLDQTIENIAAQQNIDMPAFRRELAKEGLPYEEYREQIRKELISGEVRRANVRRRVYITQQEIDNLMSLLNEQGAEQAEYRLGHILVDIAGNANEDEITEARDRAERVLELLNNGSDFARIAIAASSGAKALEGGDMGWMNINSMPTLFAEAVEGKKKDQIIGPIRSGAGFHILKITDTRGVEIVEVEEVNARHILISPSIILSDAKAEQMLTDFRAQVIAGEADFAELAKEYSEDPGSALRGGELGWNDPSIYVPEFKEALATLQKDEFSQPIRTQHGWHLIQLIDRRVDDATDKRKEDRAYQLIFNRKFQEETDAWLREMRDQAYIEVLDENA